MFVFFSTLVLLGPVFWQTSSVRAGQEFLIDPTKPSVYIRYAEVLGSKTGKRKRRLRLFNNSRSAIWVKTQSAYIQPPLIPRSEATGAIVACFTVECTPLGYKDRTSDDRVLGYPNVGSKGLSLSVPQPAMRRKPKSLYRGHGCRGHMRGRYRINSGDSTLLEVPRKYLWPRCRISIRFTYEWGERESYERNVLHEVYWP